MCNAISLILSIFLIRIIKCWFAEIPSRTFCAMGLDGKFKSPVSGHSSALKSVQGRVCLFVCWGVCFLPTGKYVIYVYQGSNFP